MVYIFHWRVMCLSPEVLEVEVILVIFLVEESMRTTFPVIVSVKAAAAAQVPQEVEQF